MSQIQDRRIYNGACPVCQGKNGQLGCASCRDRWHETPLAGTPLERYFAHIVRGGKIAGKGQQ